ncbi:endonuclease/exonuclease/phosphatase family protein [Polaribacter pacificus]|nr:endonuclease/exonuclease/phosphatase family protein [Polaribacter pacificus]
MAKNRSFTSMLVFSINLVVAILLLFSYVLPYTSPLKVPLFAVLSLTVPFLTLCNVFFFVYWLLKLKKQLLLSGSVLFLGWFFSSPLFQLVSKEETTTSDLKIMSYNVRMFNYYHWSTDSHLDDKAFEFIKRESPDVLSLQEFYQSPDISFKYPHQYIKTKSKSNKFGQAIYSKFPIINSGSLDFKNSANNVIYADIVKDKDTIRIYNIHLESLKINPNKEHFGEQSSEKLIGRLSSAFQKQASQAQEFIDHEKGWKGKKIICGDFNNTAFSWVYKQIKAGKKDAFIEAGRGFGKTFNYTFPLRIDFILVDPEMDINSFETFDIRYSDHFPILAYVQLP